MPNEILAFTTAWIASVSLTPVARRLALCFGFVDWPGPRKVHVNPIPLLGGLAIYAGVMVAVVLFVDGGSRSQIISILGGSTLLLVVGILDDGKLLHPQIKLMLATPVATFIVLASGIRATLFSSLSLDTGLESLGVIADYAISLLWVIGITAAFNIMDHMDGLCAGIAAIASAFFLFFATLSGQILVGTMAAAVLGAALGFLFWNFNPARIFMGDGGAVFLGFMLAALGLRLHLPELPEAMSWMIPVLILGVAIFDTTLVTISRLRRGLWPFAWPGKDHTAHRLANLGLSQCGVILTLYGFGCLFGILALLVCRLSIWQSYTLGGLVTLAGFAALIVLERVPYERQERLEA